MRLKSYFSATVEAAMDLARRELGEEALLVNVRPATPETRYLGAYEVVFGIQAPPSTSPDPSPAVDKLQQDVAGLRREIEHMSASLRSSTAPAPSADWADLRVDATLGIPGSARAVVALVGPPGVGKTTTLIKLAAQFGLAGRKPAQILSTNVDRIGAASQLRTLASILGIGCDVVETPLALVQALEEHRSKQLVLIDTPGWSSCEMDESLDLAKVLESHAEIDTHLLLAASMHPADRAQVAHCYASFRPSKLIFTRIDEATQCGEVVNEALRLSLPVSFLTTGQRIPDDLEPATLPRLTELAVGNSLVPYERVPRQRGLGASA